MDLNLSDCVRRMEDSRKKNSIMEYILTAMITLCRCLKRKGGLLDATCCILQIYKIQMEIKCQTFGVLFKCKYFTSLHRTHEVTLCVDLFCI